MVTHFQNICKMLQNRVIMLSEIGQAGEDNAGDCTPVRRPGLAPRDSALEW